MSSPSDPKEIRLEALSAEDLRAEIDARAQPVGRGPGGLVTLPAGDPALSDIDTPALVNALKNKQRVIYGVDDRVDHFDVADPRVAANAEAVAALFDAAEVVDEGYGSSRLVLEKFKTVKKLCNGEAFEEQPCGAFCTGFLVRPDVIATAGHCVNPDYLAHVERIRFVFGFRMKDAFTARVIIPNTDVYSGRSIIKQVLTQTAADWALVRLDRRVVGRQPLALRTSGTIDKDAPVYVLGHPCGLPLKYAPGATVRDNSRATFFKANLDTYGGNSGSPVFSAQHEIEGILVRGSTDFVRVGQCRRSMVIPTTGRNGEHVTRASEFLPELKGG